MEPERPAEPEGEERLRLPPLALPELRRRAIGDRLEAEASARRARRRLLVGTGLVAAAAALALLPVHLRGPAQPPAATTHLRTGAGDFQLLSLGERGVAFVSEGTELDLDLGGTPTLRLRHGSVHLVVRRKPGESFLVATSDAEVVVLGTEFDVTASAQGTAVSVARGEVEVRNRLGRRRLWPRESAHVGPGEAPRMVLPMTSIVVDGPAEILR